MIYILTNSDQIGGILQWTQTICSTFEKININHKVVKQVINVDMFDNESIIIINNYYFNDFYDNIQSIKNKNIKIFFVVHSTICPNNMFLQKYYDYIDKIICVAKYIEDHILKIFPVANTYVLDNYILNNKQSIAKKSSDVTNFIFVGRISSEKNIPMLLYALSLIDKTKWKLSIYGECFCKKHEELINKILDLEKLRDNVVFNGYIFDKNIIYNNCDYLILPSISEGASYCVLEALSYGIPVIACKNIGDTTIIKDGINGLLINIDGLIDTSTKIYLTDYTDILLSVGYCSTVMMYNKLRYKAIVPPKLCNKNGLLFEKNVELFSNVLKFAINKKILISPQIFITEDKYIDQLNNIFKMNWINKNNYFVKEYPLISIIIPVFNRRDKIEATIRHINDQTYPKLEIIMVDDGSTDNYSDLLEKYGKIKYIKSEINMGCWNARNIGLKNANGKYILFHDADDISNKNRIMIQYDYMHNLDLNLCGTLMVRTHIENFNDFDIDRINSQIKADSVDSTIKHNLQCCKNILGFATIMYKKVLFDDIGMYHEMKKGTDADWLVRYMEKYENIKYKTYEQLHQFMSINRFGKTYMIASNVLYYSTEFDNKNITTI